MADGTSPFTRCGIDTVEIARVERLLLGTPHEDLLRIFSKQELCDAGEGSGRTASLAARFAAKEACLKLFPRETALGLIGPADFALARDGYGAPRVVCSPRALELIARHRLKAIAVSLAHDKTSASAVAVAEPASPSSGARGSTLSSTSRALALAATVLMVWGACTGARVKGSEHPRHETTVVIGTGSIGSDYYPLGGAVCRLVNLETARHGIRCRPTTSPGSVYNVTALREGRFDLAVLRSDVQDDAVTGRGPFARQGTARSLRTVFSAYAESFAVIVRADSGIRTAADLVGRRVNVGNAGSGYPLAMERVTEALGVRRADFALVPEIPPEAQNDALCDGRADAVVYAAGHPNGIVQDAIRRCGGRLVPMSGPPVEALLAHHPEYARAVIPAGLYPDHNVDIPTFGTHATLVTTAAVPDDVVYEVVRAVLERFDDFTRLHPAFAPLDAREMAHVANRAPLHPGAERYYRERGWLP